MSNKAWPLTLNTVIQQFVGFVLNGTSALQSRSTGSHLFRVSAFLLHAKLTISTTTFYSTFISSPWLNMPSFISILFRGLVKDLSIYLFLTSDQNLCYIRRIRQQPKFNGVRKSSISTARRLFTSGIPVASKLPLNFQQHLIRLLSSGLKLWVQLWATEWHFSLLE
jgi:hypothetical protein